MEQLGHIVPAWQQQSTADQEEIPNRLALDESGHHHVEREDDEVEI